MGQPVVHFEILGKDPTKLQGFYGDRSVGTSMPATR